MSKSEVDQAVGKKMASFLDGAAVDSCDLTVADDGPPAVCISGRFTKPAAAVRVDDKMVLRPAIMSPICWSLADLGSGQRVFPLWFQAAWEEADTIRLNIPAGWEIDRMPAGAGSQGQFGSYLVAPARSGDQLTLVIHHTLDCKTVKGAALAEFRRFWAESRDRASQEAVLRRI
jgi:hypothetical protein